LAAPWIFSCLIHDSLLHNHLLSNVADAEHSSYIYDHRFFITAHEKIQHSSNIHLDGAFCYSHRPNLNTQTSLLFHYRWQNWHYQQNLVICQTWLIKTIPL